MEVQKVKSPATNSVTAPMSANSKQTFSARNFNFSKPSELSQKTELKEKGGPVINDKIASSTTKIVQLGTNHMHIKETGRNHITEDLDQLLRLGTAEGKSDVEGLFNNYSITKQFHITNLLYGYCVYTLLVKLFSLNSCITGIIILILGSFVLLFFTCSYWQNSSKQRK